MKTTKYFILLFLFILFAAPGIAAYMFYQHPAWLGSTRINKGTLLNPPVAFDTLEGKSKWHIIFWSPGACDKLCLKQLDMLARVRLALGRKLYEVDQWLILGDQAPSLSKKILSSLKKIDYKVMQLSVAKGNAKATLFSEPKVFLADPNNYLILSYSSRSNPDDVYQDLKLLLNLKTQLNRSESE